MQSYIGWVQFKLLSAGQFTVHPTSEHHLGGQYKSHQIPIALPHWWVAKPSQGGRSHFVIFPLGVGLVSSHDRRHVTRSGDSWLSPRWRSFRRDGDFESVEMGRKEEEMWNQVDGNVCRLLKEGINLLKDYNYGTGQIFKDNLFIIARGWGNIGNGTSAWIEKKIYGFTTHASITFIHTNVFTTSVISPKIE